MAVLLAVISLLGFLIVEHEPLPGVRPNLPRVSHPISMARADRKNAMIIVITRYDQVFLGPEAVRSQYLADRIREGISHESEREVYIRADAGAKYGWVGEVLDSVHSAGVEKIGFLVDQRQTPGPNRQ